MLYRVRHRKWLLLAFILLLSLSLRGPVVGIAPLLESIEHDLSLTSFASGLLTTLPILSFALFAPVATRLGRRFGIESALLVGTLLILAGMILRSLGVLPTLYSGVFLIGAGIAIGNVLLPILLKRDFSNHIIQLTAVYVLMMNIGGALITGTAVPLTLVSEQWIGNLWPSWSFALACQTLLLILPLVLWFALTKPNQTPQPTAADLIKASVWRSPVAWLITFFIAVNSVTNYIVNTWLPTILIDHGFSAVTAGLYHSYIQLAGMIPALTLPFIQRFVPTKRQLCCIATFSTLLSLVGFTVMIEFAVIWSFIYGFGVTLGFVVGISLISLRTNSVREAAALSGMAQFVGYLLAAIGPMAIGGLHDWLDEWQTALYCLIALGIIWIFLGWFASSEDT
ncbi:MFS transporter [Marinomonas piezotolerans]|uniref:MFS transporter n=1 Tax=Marinomonas piezotolerans TaxID=2213058 RepID=A0A370UAN1_9GAMM|nr:MFS transporter [Marinomonas piezotolerans]RDL44857.1 MFS transporter [Marinomonas piezotolerans]